MRNIPYTSPAFKQPLAIANKQAFIEVLTTCPDAVVAPSHAIADALVRNGVPAASVVVIPHGIPLPERKPLQQGLGRRPLRFVYVGRISRVKGLHVMLQALSGLFGDAWELHIVGAAVTKPELRYLAMLQYHHASLNVHWHGGLPADQVLQWLYHCDVMMHPAIYLEVFGLTIAEAMAAGRPVIASRCGGAEMQIQDGDNGWLVPTNDADALRMRIQSLLEAPEQVQDMADRLGEVNSLEQHVNDIARLYQRVLARREKEATP
ncbi:glycosyltransferase family 4 protein [Alcanivorax sp. IO_7]|nr:glycosyltransferase family 4 protein [Alcanivorax sp. IO_7]